MILVMITSICGNFVAAGIAKRLGYRRTIALMCVAYFLFMLDRPTAWRGPTPALFAGGLAAIGVCQGLFGLFTMYLPPLFPTLLRTTGAGFCYNIGRIVAAAGTVFFGLFSQGGRPPFGTLLRFVPLSARGRLRHAAARAARRGSPATRGPTAEKELP